MEATQQSHHLMKRVIDSKVSQECVRTVASPKPNQVGTVLLYGIPIVSLYIESQERLCLAQISNTLLKQFSYNEIHNRRVALGITCVQCTPVQLEILRRAGAMPVSSRRCGMITRREAERLCKSFLGDNAPPRLPEDFAFSVHHECAWGCRGSFLPSRYNSSRAKCIKCSYCGLFFSPNKFIFHSHRIGPGDKYVQPDAANFNSWRRHMKLSGNPPEEIIHAWEDVKAMFNGGTRKRLMSNSPNASQSAPSPKRIKQTQISPPLIHAAAAAVVSAAATANVTQFPIRPVNIHHPPSPTTTSSTPRIPGLGGDLPLPFSRSFMMDYMWHAQNKSSLQFPSYTLPWIKRPASLLFTQQTTDSPNSEDAVNPTYNNISNSNTTSESPSLITAIELESKSPSFYNNSAFKPVINQGRNTFSTATALAIGALIDDDQRTSSRNSREEVSTIKESISSDDEMVDIETTEEEHNNSDVKYKSEVVSIKVPESPPIEVENSIDMGWEGIMKKENSGPVNLGNNIRSTTPVPSTLSLSSSPSVVNDHHTIGSGSIPTTAASIDVTKATTQVTPSILTAGTVNSRTNLNNNTNNCNNNLNPSVTTNNHSGNELWSVARFSFDRPDYRIPFYRHDITKHFQTFRHGETTTQTNGIG